VEKEHLNFVIVGHVDHGKSTLIGRLLYDTDSLPDSIVDEVRNAAESMGRKMEFAYLLDSLKEEREQNITIDTTQTFFHTEKRDYVIIDAPGHKEYLRNMITGASLASAAIIMLDVSRGIEEQTTRHSFILKLLGVEQIIVAVNKMDLVDYQEDSYRKAGSAIGAFLEKVGLKASHIIPISAFLGENVARRSGAMSWYKGKTILEALDSFQAPESENKKPLRFAVQDVYDIDGKKILVGKVESGTLKKGEAVELYPSQRKAEIQSIEVWQQRRAKAEAGDAIGLTLKPEMEVSRGEVLCTGRTPQIARELETTVFWMDQKPLSAQCDLAIKCATQEVPCEVANIQSRINSSTLEVLAENTRELGEAEAGTAVIRTETPLVIEDFNHIEGLGRFVLVRNDDIVAGGIIHGWR